VKKCLAVQLLLAFIPAVQAADIAAGKAKVEAVCAVCHGVNGVSVNETVPNLAAQRAGYIEAQLKALKEGSRRASVPTSPTATMAAIAAQLTPEEMANVAAYFASLPGAPAGAKSQFIDAVAKTHVTFPENYKATFVKYHAINFPGAKQVRYYYANPVAIRAAREGKDLPDGSILFAEVYSAKVDAGGKPIVGDDKSFVADKLVGYTAMSRDAGWGNDIPEMLRNENWNYAVFTPEKQARTTVNQAECLACHKPLDKVSYTFTLKELTAAAKK
jgi:cytochrome c553